jgi:hypothetical protein
MFSIGKTRFAIGGTKFRIGPPNRISPGLAVGGNIRFVVGGGGLNK